MKKITAIIMCVILLMLAFVVGGFAGQEEITQEESATGFRFSYMYVTIKGEYTFKFEKFTPEMFSEELVESVENVNPYNPDEEYIRPYLHVLKLNIKEPSEQNIIKLYLLMRDNEYVLEQELAYTGNYFPVYPESGTSLPVYYGQYSPFLERIDDHSQTIIKNMLHNPYYKIYYNQLLAFSVYLYNMKSKYLGDFDYINFYINNHIDETPCYVTLILDVDDNGKSMREKNLEILAKYFDEEEILYVGDTVNAAVVCVDSSYKEILVNMEELKFIGDAFFNSSDSDFLLCVTGQFMLGDVCGEKNAMYVEYDSVTAADARYILRYSAGLEVASAELKRFYYCADMNFDGEITSADARLALRTAAGLEEKYQLVFGYSVSWQDQMIDNV